MVPWVTLYHTSLRIITSHLCSSSYRVVMKKSLMNKGKWNTLCISHLRIYYWPVHTGKLNTCLIFLWDIIYMYYIHKMLQIMSYSYYSFYIALFYTKLLVTFWPWNSTVFNRPWTSIQDLLQPNSPQTPVAAVTVYSAPVDGRKGRSKHVEHTCSF